MCMCAFKCDDNKNIYIYQGVNLFVLALGFSAYAIFCDLGATEINVETYVKLKAFPRYL